MLEASEVRLDLGGRTILDGVSISVPKGSIVGLVGPNGAGKTSLIRILGGLIRATSGRVSVMGRGLEEFTRREIARRVALVFQEAPPITGFRVRDVVSMGRYPHVSAWRGPTARDAEAIDRAIEVAGIAELGDRPHQELSGGERQLVQLARALAQSPSVLLMDEPTANLDVRHQRKLGERLRVLADGGLALLVSTHDINAVLRWCDRACLLSQGRAVAQGKPEEVLSRERIRETFGVDPETRSPFAF